MATSKEKFYTEMCNTLTDYNDGNNTPLSNSYIQKEIRKFMEEEPTADANKVTADTFSYASNTQREHPITIFTSEKIDKSDDIVDAVKNLTIIDAGYYESHKAKASDAQENLTHNQEKVTHIRNRSFEKEN